MGTGDGRPGRAQPVPALSVGDVVVDGGVVVVEEGGTVVVAPADPEAVVVSWPQAWPPSSW